MQVRAFERYISLNMNAFATKQTKYYQRLHILYALDTAL